MVQLHLDLYVVQIRSYMYVRMYVGELEGSVGIENWRVQSHVVCIGHIPCTCAFIKERWCFLGDNVQRETVVRSYYFHCARGSIRHACMHIPLPVILPLNIACDMVHVIRLH